MEFEIGAEHFSGKEGRGFFGGRPRGLDPEDVKPEPDDFRAERRVCRVDGGERGGELDSAWNKPMEPMKRDFSSKLRLGRGRGRRGREEQSEEEAKGNEKERGTFAVRAAGKGVKSVVEKQILSDSMVLSTSCNFSTAPDKDNGT